MQIMRPSVFVVVCIQSMKNMGVVTLVWLVVVWLIILQTDASFNSYNFNNGTFLYTCGVNTHFFTEAVELCKQANAQLAVIKNEGMFNAAVQAVSTNCSSVFQFRIGLRKNASTGNEYRWLDGSRFDSQQVGGRIITNVSTDACLAVMLHIGVIKTLQTVSCNVAFNVLCYRSSISAIATTTVKSDNGTTTQTPTTVKTTQPTKPTTDVETSAQATTNKQTVALPTSSPIQVWLIIVIVILVISFLIFSVGIIYCCWWKKRNQASGKSNGRNRPAERFQPLQLMDSMHTYENTGPVQPPVETPYCNVEPSTNEDAYEIFDVGKPK